MNKNKDVDKNQKLVQLEGIRQTINKVKVKGRYGCCLVEK